MKIEEREKRKIEKTRKDERGEKRSLTVIKNLAPAFSFFFKEDFER